MVVKDENDFEISEFYRLWILEKVENLMKFLIFFQIFRKFSRLKRKDKRRKRGRAPALRVIRAETRLTVYRSLPITLPGHRSGLYESFFRATRVGSTSQQVEIFLGSNSKPEVDRQPGFRWEDSQT